MLQNKSQLVANIIDELSDNATESITPYHIRHNLIDIVDSVPGLLSDINLVAKNVKTHDVRTSILGERAIERIGFPNYSSEDNSAFGYAALRINFRGNRNTAIGSQALRTNIHGSDNVSVGYDSLAANVAGSGNVGIGNFALTSNKNGDFNIAIGHGAGYYIGGDDSYQFYLGSAPVDSGVLCYSSVDGSDFIPLLRGDLQSNKLGINTPELVNDATLQVGGSISPTSTEQHDIGTSSLIWNSLYSNNIFLSDTKKFSNGQGVSFNFSLVPENHNSYDLGSSSNHLNNVYTNNLLVEGSASINNAEFINISYYINKTLNLASRPEEVILDGGGAYSIYDYALESANNTLLPYLSLSQVNGAGLKVHTNSGDSFDFLLDTNNPDNAFWKSNISLDLGSGNYVKTDKVISGPEFSVDFGENVLSLKDNYLYFGDKVAGENNTLGFGNINFYDTHKIISSYLCSNSTNTSISQRFFSDASGPESGGSYTGFEISYENRLTSIISNPPSTFPGHIGFSIKSFSMFDSGKTPSHSLFLSRDNSTHIFAISDIDEYDAEATADFNIADNCSLRVKSRSDDKTSTIFLDTGNRGDAQISCDEALHLGFGRIPPASPQPLPTYKYQMSLHDTHLDLFNSVSGTQNFTINIGDAVNTNASIGLRHSEDIPIHASGYACVFTKPKFVGRTVNNQTIYTQSSTLMLLDSTGNEFDLVRSEYNTSDGLLFVSNTNTFGGLDSFNDKYDVSCDNNAGLGFESLRNVSSGSKNTAYGSGAGKSISTGSYNTAVGYKAMSANQVGNHNIVICTNGAGSEIKSDYNFILGMDDSNILLRGVLGPEDADKILELPKQGKIALYNSTDTEYVKIDSHSISVVDKGGANYPDFALDFTFTGNQSNTLFSLNHEDAPLNYDDYYADISGPFAKINGNLKVKGSICFGDGSSISSSNEQEINNIQNEQNIIRNQFSALLVEGTANRAIIRPNNIDSPTTGNITTISGETVQISNRDPNLSIKQGDYVIGIKIGNEYRPIWVSNEFNALVSF